MKKHRWVMHFIHEGETLVAPLSESSFQNEDEVAEWFAARIEAAMKQEAELKIHAELHCANCGKLEETDIVYELVPEGDEADRNYAKTGLIAARRATKPLLSKQLEHGFVAVVSVPLDLVMEVLEGAIAALKGSPTD